MNIYRSGDENQRKSVLRPLSPNRERRQANRPPQPDAAPQSDSHPPINRLTPVERSQAPAEGNAEQETDSPPRVEPISSGSRSGGRGVGSLAKQSVRIPIWAAIALALVLVAVPSTVLVTQYLQPTATGQVDPQSNEVAAGSERTAEEIESDIDALLDEEFFEEVPRDEPEPPEVSPRQEYLAEQGVRPDRRDVLYRAEEMERLQQELEAIQRNSALLRSLAREQSGDLSAAYSSLEATEAEKEGALEDLQQRIDELEGRIQTVDELARELRDVLGLPEPDSGVGGPAEQLGEDADPWLAMRSQIVSIEHRAAQLVFDLNEINTEIQARIAAKQEAEKRAAAMQEDEVSSAASVQSNNEFYESMPVGFPIEGPITSRFGLRGNPFGSGNDMHTGIDISAPLGSAVRATGSGTVRLAGQHGGYGLLVIIDHGRGVSSWYGHNSRLRVSPGQNVSAGDVIADVGSTGMSTGPHVHYEIRVNNNPEDPMPRMQMGR